MQELHISADDCFNNNNNIIIVIIILVLSHIGRKISLSCGFFYFIFFSKNISCGYSVLLI